MPPTSFELLQLCPSIVESLKQAVEIRTLKPRTLCVRSKYARCKLHCATYARYENLVAVGRIFTHSQICRGLYWYLNTNISEGFCTSNIAQSRKTTLEMKESDFAETREYVIPDG